MQKKTTTRINLNLSDELIEEIDKFADKLHLNRTAAMTVLLSQALDASTGMATLTKLMDEYTKQQSLIEGGNDALPAR